MAHFQKTHLRQLELVFFNEDSWLMIPNCHCTYGTLQVSKIQLEKFKSSSLVCLSMVIGQERFRSMAPMYYRGAKAVILVFDVTNVESYNRIDTWLKDVVAHSKDGIIICLVGNKSDLPPAFDLSVCEEKAKELNGVFIKTSAILGTNINELFETVAVKAVKLHAYNSRSISKEVEALNSGAISLDSKTNETKSSCC